MPQARWRIMPGRAVNCCNRGRCRVVLAARFTNSPVIPEHLIDGPTSGREQCGYGCGLHHNLIATSGSDHHFRESSYPPCRILAVVASKLREVLPMLRIPFATLDAFALLTPVSTSPPSSGMHRRPT